MTITTLASLLDQQGTGLREAEVVAAVAELLSGRFGVGQRGAVAALSPDAEAVLRSSSGLAEPQDKALELAAQDTTAATVALVAGSRSVAELAAALGVDASRVRHRAGDGALYAVKVGRSNRFPVWQLDAADRPIVGLREVLSALPDDLHPLEVEGFMLTPQPELRVGRHDLSPRDWLVGGGRPSVVAGLADSLSVAM